MTSPPKKIAIVFAGECYRKHEKSYDYLKSFKFNILDPLKNYGYDVFIFVACEFNEVKNWKQYFDSIENCNITISPYTNSCVSFNDSKFFQCHHRDCFAYYQQYSHLFYSYNLLCYYEKSNNIMFDYIIKSRNDLFFNDKTLFNPNWLSYIHDDTICCPSTEFHNFNRWVENHQLTNTMMSDQFIFGSRRIMDIYFNLINDKSPISHNHPHGIETILRQYINSKQIKVQTVNFQFSQPGGRFVLGKTNKWLPGKSRFDL